VWCLTFELHVSTFESVQEFLKITFHKMCNVSVTIVLMVMLMLVLARMLIFRTLVKRSTVHNNGGGDVNVRNDVAISTNII
jgi:hypothetical protein